MSKTIAPALIAAPHVTDPARAKQLLAEAGYPNGFAVTLDCTNDRYILDEQLCSAVAGMLTRIGIVTTPNPKPKAIFFQKIDVANRETSLFIYGAYPTTVDAHTIVESYLHTNMGGRGDFNTAGYSNAKMDALIDAAQSELEPGVRNRHIECPGGRLATTGARLLPLPSHPQLSAPGGLARRALGWPP